jgi:hypothetical protein
VVEPLAVALHRLADLGSLGPVPRPSSDLQLKPGRDAAPRLRWLRPSHRNSASTQGGAAHTVGTCRSPATPGAGHAHAVAVRVASWAQGGAALTHAHCRSPATPGPGRNPSPLGVGAGAQGGAALRTANCRSPATPGTSRSCTWTRLPRSQLRLPLVLLRRRRFQRPAASAQGGAAHRTALCRSPATPGAGHTLAVAVLVASWAQGGAALTHAHCRSPATPGPGRKSSPHAVGLAAVAASAQGGAALRVAACRPPATLVTGHAWQRPLRVVRPASTQGGAALATALCRSPATPGAGHIGSRERLRRAAHVLRAGHGALLVVRGQRHLVCQVTPQGRRQPRRPRRQTGIDHPHVWGSWRRLERHQSSGAPVGALVRSIGRGQAAVGHVSLITLRAAGGCWTTFG